MLPWFCEVLELMVSALFLQFEDWIVGYVEELMVM